MAALPARVALFFFALLGLSRAAAEAKALKDVKADVRMNGHVDMPSVVLLLAFAAMAMFSHRQNKQES